MTQTERYAKFRSSSLAGQTSMNFSQFATVLAAAALVFFTSGVESSPRVQSPAFSSLPLQAGLRCGLVNGQVVCGNKNSKHNDGQGSYDHDHGKGKKKKAKGNDDASELSECTIQGANGGGGCKTGFKRVCEKLKSGKKCCGCVPDKSGTSAGKTAPPAGADTEGTNKCSGNANDNVLWGDYCYTNQQQ
jgi:hypothetical protein